MALLVVLVVEDFVEVTCGVVTSAVVFVVEIVTFVEVVTILLLRVVADFTVFVFGPSDIDLLW